jgi:AcrR family transcriptional regulator
VTNYLSSVGLRDRKKAATRRALQEQALRLFLAKGYETTTVQEISAAAGVSHMTFFRYFPTKEDVVLADEYDPVVLELVRQRPATEPDIDKIQHALLKGLRQVYETDRDAIFERTRLILRTPALRARLWQNQAETQELLVHALSTADGTEATLERRVLASACLAAVTSAILNWVEEGGRTDLPAVVENAFSALDRAFGQRCQP